jgi:hypothetical protein
MLERRTKAGETSKLRVSAEIDMFGEKVSYSVLQTEKVLSVEADGSYTVETRQSEAIIRYGANATPSPDSPARTAVYRANGELVRVVGPTPDPTELRTARMSAFISPGREVKSGESWTHESPGTPQNGGISGRSEYRSEGPQKGGDSKVHVVAFKFKELSGETPASSEGKFWIDSETGNLVRMECQWTNAPMTGAPRPMNAKVTIVREA